MAGKSTSSTWRTPSRRAKADIEAIRNGSFAGRRAAFALSFADRPCPVRSSASRRAPTAISISATPFRRSRPTRPRGRSAVGFPRPSAASDSAPALAAPEAPRRERNGVWPRDPDGAPLYPGLHRGLGPAERAALVQRRPALRLKMDEAIARAGAGLTWRELGDAGGEIEAHPEAWGDVVLA